MRVETSTTVYCDHDQIVSKDGKRRQTTCGCYEAEVCSGCGKEDCMGCPCGTHKTIKKGQPQRAHVCCSGNHDRFDSAAHDDYIREAAYRKTNGTLGI